MNNMDVNKINSIFTEYTDLLVEPGKDELINRFEELLKSLEEFINKMGYSENVRIDELALLYALCDYSSDILRLQKFHKISECISVKNISYQVYWLLKRRPLQIMRCDKELVHVNEQFALTRILHYLSDYELTSLAVFEKEDLKFFVNTLFYYMKFRTCDAQALEMILLAFNAGSVYAKEFTLS